MKRLIAVAAGLILMVSSCATYHTAIPSQRTVTDPQERVEILRERYPDVYAYNEHGLVKFRKFVEVREPDGSVSYKIDYRTVTRDIVSYQERMAILEAQYPQIYEMFLEGLVHIGTMYEYVASDGTIRSHVYWYRTAGDAYYYYDYYRGIPPIRYRPVPPPAPRVAPAP